MQIRLLLDANISWRSTDILKHNFDECEHVDYIGLDVPARDTEIWDYALEQNMVIVTNDEDFLYLSSSRGFPPKTILLRTGNQSRKYIEKLLINMKKQIVLFIESPEHGVLELI